jgi:hypothetical protein
MERNLFFGLTALAGMLFVVWLGQHERQAAVERLERYEIRHTTGIPVAGARGGRRDHEAPDF